MIGDPRLAEPLALPVDPVSDEQNVLDDPLGSPASELGLEESDGSDMALPTDGDRLAGPVLALPENGLIPRFWVDAQELQVRRIDRKSGVFVVFGPMVNFEKLKVPAWFEIHEPGAQTVRFDVDRAVQVNAPPQAFSRKWLLAPADPPAPSASDGSRPPAASSDPAGTKGPATR